MAAGSQSCASSNPVGHDGRQTDVDVSEEKCTQQTAFDGQSALREHRSALAPIGHAAAHANMGGLF